MNKFIKYTGLCFGALLFALCAHAQPNITRVEYYIDVDPGFGNATAMSIVPGIDLADQNIAINPATITEGVHRLYVRAQDANGRWSMTNTWLFYKPYGSGVTVATLPPPSNITRLEYYIDIDPGFGNATALIITPSTDIQDAIIPINPATVSEGVHRLYVRARDADGKWSLTNTWLFYKPYGSGGTAPALQPPSNITRVEYYIDNDPGNGNATTLSIASSTDIQDAIISINPATISEGVHRLYVRALNANGNWSLTNTWLFYKPYANTGSLAVPAIAKLSKLEYYIDNDPGYGNGVPVALDSVTDIADYIVPINVTGLTTGNHNLWMRGLDKNGKWSMMNKLLFTVPSLLPTPSIVVNSVTRKTNCARDSLSVSYHVTGTYNAGNIFNVELSDATGTFAATPIIIGSFTGTGNTIINAMLPSHFADGTNYKVRVTSTNPVVLGVTGSDALTIRDRPYVQTITGDANVNAGYSYPYSVPNVTGSTWLWMAPASTITQTANSASLLWNTVGQPQSIKIIETNQYGCVGDTSSKNVNVYALKITDVVPSKLTPCPDEALTVAANAHGVYYSGNTFTAQLSDAAGTFAAPVTIGTLIPSPQPPGNAQPIAINVRLPFPLANGTNYRIRILSSNYAKTSDTSAAIVVNKPNLGADQARIKCPGFPVDLSTVFTTTGLTTLWNVTRPDSVVATGTYRLIVTNANGCKDTADVVVTNYPKPDIGPDLSRGKCVGFTFNLAGLYTDPALTYSWNTATPSAAEVGVYQVIATNSNGCKDTALVTVTNFAQPAPSFTINSTTQCLSGNSFVFTNTSTIGSGTLIYQWSFGDNTSSTATSPTKVFTVAGTYNVKLVVTTNNGCKDSISQSVTVNPQPAPAFTINSITQCLGGNSFVFTNTSTISSASMTYQWSFGDNTSSTATSPTKVFTVAGSYSVKLVVTTANGCKDSITRSVTVNVQPVTDFTINNATQCVKGNSFSFTNTSGISSGSITSYQWTFGDNTSSTSTSTTRTYTSAGTYNVKLIATSNNGCKDSVTKVTTVNPSPDLGADKSITAGCAGGTADIRSVYNTTGYSSVTYNTADPQNAPVGTHRLIVANNNGCTDTAFITVLNASVVTVPAMPNNTKMASRECTDAQGWTHYYNDNGTPADFGDDIRILSIKKNGNNIGTVGNGVFEVKAAATTGAGTNRAVNVNSPWVTPATSFYSMNRYWKVTAIQQPLSPISVRFYYNTQDLNDVNGDYPTGPVSHTQLNMYKLQAGNPDPTTNWAGATGVTYYQHDAIPSLNAWTYNDLGNNIHQAEFMVSSFSGGGAGAKTFVILPVTILKFDVVGEKDKVKLTWSTATEVNTKEFEVQRSLDGTNFTAIAKIAAAGNSTSLVNYHYNDAQAIQFKGKLVYYRLLQTDLGGQGKYTEVKTIRIANQANSVVLMYNPVRHEALLKYDAIEKDKVTIRIVDLAGRIVLVKEVFAEAGTNQFRLNTSSLAQGIYEVQLLSSKDHHHVRMMKE